MKFIVKKKIKICVLGEVIAYSMLLKLPIYKIETTLAKLSSMIHNFQIN